jgi:hypothetical protein
LLQHLSPFPSWFGKTEEPAVFLILFSLSFFFFQISCSSCQREMSGELEGKLALGGAGQVVSTVPASQGGLIHTMATVMGPFKGIILSVVGMVLGVEEAVYEPVQTSVAEDEDFSPVGLFRTVRNYTVRPFVHGMFFAFGTYISLSLCNRYGGFQPECLCYYMHKTAKAASTAVRAAK